MNKSSNKDNLISFEEFVAKKQVPYLKTGGKKRLNVLYKFCIRSINTGKDSSESRFAAVFTSVY